MAGLGLQVADFHSGDRLFFASSSAGTPRNSARCFN
jgi:hypothetical protein